MILSNKAYDLLKWIALYLLPGASALYFALSKIWGLPYGVEVVGTLAAIIAFIGTLIGISTVAYNKIDRSDGVLEIDTMNWENELYRLNITTGLEDIKHKNEITLKVDPTANISQKKQGL